MLKAAILGENCSSSPKTAGLAADKATVLPFSNGDHLRGDPPQPWPFANGGPPQGA